MAVTVNVNGVNVTSKHKTQGFAIRNSGMQGIAVAQVDFVDEAGTASILLEHVLQILDGATEIFEGPIRHRDREAVKDPGIAKKTYSVQAQDYTTFLADDIIDVTLVRTGSRTDKVEVEYLVTTYGLKGITVGATVLSTGTISRDIDYTGMNLYEALEEATKWLGTAFYVDSNLVLHWFVTETNAAPFNLSDTPNGSTTFGYRDLQLSDDSGDYANAVFVVGDGISGWWPTSPPAGATRRAISIRDVGIKNLTQLNAAGAAALAKQIVTAPVSLRTFQPGLKAGMTTQLTNALWGISAVTYVVLEVTTTYLEGTNSLQYRLQLNAKKPTLASLFGSTEKSIVGVAGDAQTAATVLTDLSVGGANLVSNGSFEDGTAWSVGSGWAIGYVSADPFAQSGVARGQVTGAVLGALFEPSASFIQINRLDDYWISAWSKMLAYTSGTGNFEVSEYNAAGTLLLTTVIASVTAAQTVWTRMSKRFGPNNQLGRTAWQTTTTKIRVRFVTPAVATMTWEVDGVQVERGSVLTAFAPTPYELIDGSITGTKIAALTVALANLAANSVDTSKILTGAITTLKIAADAVTAAEIAVGAVGSSEIAAGAVIAGKITAGTIVAADIAAGTITGAKIAAGTITASNILANTITANEIAALAITTSELAAGSVTTLKLAALAVDATKIAANAIVAGKIAAGVITSAEIAANAIIADKIAAGSIDATKIAAGAIHVGQFAGNPGQLVPNGGFETGTPVAAGGAVVGWNSNAAFSTAIAGTGHTGRGVGIIAGTTTLISFGSVYVPILGGRSIRLRGWVCGQAGNSANASGTIAYQFADSDQVYISSAPLATRTVGTSGTWQEITAIVAVPANAAYVSFGLRNLGGTSVSVVRYDDIEAYYVDNDVWHAAGTVQIDTTGVHITNGALTVTNGGGTVIIDGTSNMFKIAATGTLSCVNSLGGAASSNVVLTGLSPGGVPPQLQAIAQWGSGVADPSLSLASQISSVFVATTSGGAVTANRYAMTLLAYWTTALSGTIDANITLLTHNASGASKTASGRYYVMKEAAI